MSTTVKFPCIVARDVTQLSDFYARALGLQLRFQDGGRWSQLKTGSVDLAIANPEEAAPVPAGTVTVFQVEDMASASAGIEAAGGRAVHYRSMGSHGEVATCVDIEGNFFQIFSPSRKERA